MILADKIIALRKKNGWSQEELAERLDVSRQSVSKWEGGLSVPDMNKIIGMSALFGVSTDYLLKDELEHITPSETQATDDAPQRTVGAEEANRYLDTVKRISSRIALGVALCILSPALLLTLVAFSDPSSPCSIPEGTAVALGMAGLFVLVGAAVALFVVFGTRLLEFSYLEKEPFTLGYGVKGIVEKAMQCYQTKYLTGLTVGIVLCIFSVIPLLTMGALDAADFTLILCTAGILALCSVGVGMIVRVCYINGACLRLLQTGEFSAQSKREEKKFEAIDSAYWGIFAAIYLGISFVTMAWHLTWIVWVVAGCVFPLFRLIADGLIKH